MRFTARGLVEVDGARPRPRSRPRAASRPRRRRLRRRRCRSPAITGQRPGDLVHHPQRDRLDRRARVAPRDRRRAAGAGSRRRCRGRAACSRASARRRRRRPRRGRRRRPRTVRRELGEQRAAEARAARTARDDRRGRRRASGRTSRDAVLDVRAAHVDLDRRRRRRRAARAARAAPAKSSTDAAPERHDHRAPMPRAARAARRSIQRSTPGPCSPTEFSIPPPVAACSRGAGLPAHANAAQRLDGDRTEPRRVAPGAATSAPCPNVPDAATIGLAQLRGRRPSPACRRVAVATALRSAGPVLTPRAAAGRRGGTPAASGRWRRWLGHSAMPGRRGERGGDGGEARDPVDDRGPADVGAVGPRPTAPRRVDHQVDLARRDQLDRVHPAGLAHLGHHRLRPGSPRSSQRGRGPGGGDDREPELGEARGRRRRPVRPCRGPRARGTPCPSRAGGRRPRPGSSRTRARTSGRCP